MLRRALFRAGAAVAGDTLPTFSFPSKDFPKLSLSNIAVACTSVFGGWEYYDKMRVSSEVASQTKLAHVETKMTQIDSNTSHLQTHFGKFETKMDSVETKMDAKVNLLETKIDAKMNLLEVKLNALETKMDTKLQTGFADLQALVKSHFATK
eukprot:GDKI01010940.1.p1 GENE.GDKI01010940.1~~GDKI01010940.1.p1  ORF type:complete len:152 (-),score=36.71 GDKI01010940.1:169-624(-)